MYRVNKYLQQIKKQQPNFKYYEHIFSEQTEFIRYINKNEQNTCIVVDEFNRLAETGLNATTETILFDQYSDQFAQDFIHRIACSPHIIADRNATIILDVIGTDKKHRNKRRSSTRKKHSSNSNNVQSKQIPTTNQKTTTKLQILRTHIPMFFVGSYYV